MSLGEENPMNGRSKLLVHPQTQLPLSHTEVDDTLISQGLPEALGKMTHAAEGRVALQTHTVPKLPPTHCARSWQWPQTDAKAAQTVSVAPSWQRQELCLSWQRDKGAQGIIGTFTKPTQAGDSEAPE